MAAASALRSEAEPTDVVQRAEARLPSIAQSIQREVQDQAKPWAIQVDNHIRALEARASEIAQQHRQQAHHQGP